MVKGISSKSPTSGDGTAGALAVITTLYGLIKVGSQVGACYNPAVSVAFIFLEMWQATNSNNIYTHYLLIYFVGSLVGGLFAGAFSVFNRKVHDKFASESEEKPATEVN